MISGGIDVKMPNEYGFTPLSIASGHESAKIVDMLIKAGADVNAKDWHNVTALMMAAGYSRNPNVLKLLLDAKASILC